MPRQGHMPYYPGGQLIAPNRKIRSMAYLGKEGYAPANERLASTLRVRNVHRAE